VRLTDRQQDHKLDFVVGLAGYGIVVLEVKGSEVRCDPDGRWTIPWGTGCKVAWVVHATALRDPAAAPAPGVRQHIPLPRERWGATLQSDDDSDFWERRLPGQMVQLAEELTRSSTLSWSTRRQDFADAWWPALLAALRDGESGGVYVFTDEGQRVFARFGGPPIALVPGWRRKTSRCSPRAVAPEQKVRQEEGQGRLLGVVLGRQSGLLRPRPRLQGAGTSRRRPCPERVRAARAVPGAAVRRAVPGARSARGVR
jgi:hypothetical protein